MGRQRLRRVAVAGRVPVRCIVGELRLQRSFGNWFVLADEAMLLRLHGTTHHRTDGRAEQHTEYCPDERTDGAADERSDWKPKRDSDERPERRTDAGPDAGLHLGAARDMRGPHRTEG